MSCKTIIIIYNNNYIMSCKTTVFDHVIMAHMMQHFSFFTQQFFDVEVLGSIDGHSYDCFNHEQLEEMLHEDGFVVLKAIEDSHLPKDAQGGPDDLHHVFKDIEPETVFNEQLGDESGQRVQIVMQTSAELAEEGDKACPTMKVR